MRVGAVVLFVCLFGITKPASASVIGSFDWLDERFLGIGSIFSVTNTSTDTFMDVFLDLYTPVGTTPFYSVHLGDIDSGMSVQSIDDLSFLSIPSDLDRATLRLDYLSSAVRVTLSASSLIGDPSSFLIGSTEIESTARVPEPATWILVAAGAVGFGITRRRR